MTDPALAGMAERVKTLRAQTNAGILDCKKALEATNGSLEAAAIWLDEQGLRKVAKVAGRSATEGAVFAAVAPDHRSGVLLEINCETDFVARDLNFLEFATTLIGGALAQAVPDLPALLAGRFNASHSVTEAQGRLITQLGENIAIRRYLRIEAPNAESGVFTYVHHHRIAALVVLDRSLPEVGKDMAMHVVGMSPLYVSPTAIPAAVRAAAEAEAEAWAIGEGKAPGVIPKIVEGRVRKQWAESCLTEQAFFKDPDQTAGAYLRLHGAEVLEFVRYAMGEGLLKPQHDFAAEVYAQAGTPA